MFCRSCDRGKVGNDRVSACKGISAVETVDPSAGSMVNESSRASAPGNVKPAEVGPDMFGDCGSRGETEGLFGSMLWRVFSGAAV